MAENQFLAEALQQHEANWNGWDLERTQTSTPIQEQHNLKAFEHNSQLAGAGYNRATVNNTFTDSNGNTRYGYDTTPITAANNARIAAGKKTDTVTNAYNSWFNPNGANFKDAVENQTMVTIGDEETPLHKYLTKYANNTAITESGFNRLFPEYRSAVEQYEYGEKLYNDNVNDANKTIRTSLREHPSIATLMEQDTTNKNYIDRFQAAQQKLIDAYSTISLIGKKDSDGFYTAQQMTDAFNLLNMAGTLPDRKEVETFWNWYSSIDGDGFNEWLNSKTNEEKDALNGKSADAQYQLYLQSPEYQSQKINMFYNGIVNNPLGCLPSEEQFEVMVRSGIIEADDSWYKNHYYGENSYRDIDVTYAYNEYKNSVLTSYYPDYWKTVLFQEGNEDLVQKLIELGYIKVANSNVEQYGPVDLNASNYDLSGVSFNAIHEWLDDAGNNFGKADNPDFDLTERDLNLPEGWTLSSDRNGATIYVDPNGERYFTLPKVIKNEDGTEAELRTGDDSLLNAINSANAILSEGAKNLSAWTNFMLFCDDLSFNAEKWGSTFVSGMLQLERALFDVQHKNETINRQIENARESYFTATNYMEIVKGVSDAPQIVFDIAENMMNMAFDRFAGGPASLAVMGARVFGEQANETYDPETDTFNVGLAILRTVSEVASEMVFGGPFYSGVINPLGKIARSNAPALLKLGACMLISGGAEGLEEIISAFINAGGDRLLRAAGNNIADEQMTRLSIKELGYEFIVAAACAAIGCVGGVTTESVRAKSLSAGINNYISSIGSINADEAIRAVTTGEEVNGLSVDECAAWLVNSRESLSNRQLSKVIELADFTEEYRDTVNKCKEAITNDITGQIKENMTQKEFENIVKNNASIRTAIEYMFGKNLYSEDMISQIEYTIASVTKTIDKNGSIIDGKIDARQIEERINVLFDGLINNNMRVNLIGNADVESLTTDEDIATYVCINIGDETKVSNALASYNRRAEEIRNKQHEDVAPVQEEMMNKEAETAYEDSLKVQENAINLEIEELQKAYESLMATTEAKFLHDAPDLITALSAKSVVKEADGWTITYTPDSAIEQAKETEGKIKNLTEELNEIKRKHALAGQIASGLVQSKGAELSKSDIRAQQIYDILQNAKYSSNQYDLALRTWMKCLALSTSSNDVNLGGVSNGKVDYTKAHDLYLAEMQKSGYDKANALTMLNQKYTQLYKNSETKQQAKGYIEQMGKFRRAFVEDFKAAKEFNEANPELFNEAKATAFIRTGEEKSDANTWEKVDIQVNRANITSMSRVLSEGTTITEDGTRIIKPEVKERVQAVAFGYVGSKIDIATTDSAIKVELGFFDGTKDFSQTLNGLGTESRKYEVNNRNIFDLAPKNLKDRMESAREKYGNKRAYELSDEGLAEVVPVLQDVARYLSEYRQFTCYSLHSTFSQQINEAAEQAPKEKTTLAKAFDAIDGRFCNIDTAISFELGYSEASKTVREIITQHLASKMQWRDGIYGIWFRDKNMTDAVASARSDKVTIGDNQISGMEAICALRLLKSGKDVVSRGNGLKCGDVWIVEGDKALQQYKNTGNMTEEEFNNRINERAEMRNGLIGTLESQLKGKSYFNIVNSGLVYSYSNALGLANLGRFCAFGEQLSFDESYTPWERVENAPQRSNMGSKTVHTQDETHNLGSRINNGQDIIVRDALEQLVDYTDRMSNQVYDTMLGRNLTKLNSVKGSNGEKIEISKAMSKIIDRLMYGNSENISDSILGMISGRLAVAHLALNPSSALKQMPSFTMANAYTDAHRADMRDPVYGKTARFLTNLYIKNGDIEAMTSEGYSEELQAAYSVKTLRNLEAKKYYDTYGKISNWCMGSVRFMDSATTLGVTRVVTASTIRQTLEDYNTNHPDANLTKEQVCEILTNPNTEIDSKIVDEVFDWFANKLEANLTLAMFTQPTSDVMMSANLGAWKYFLPYMGQRIQYLNKAIQCLNDMDTASTPELKAEATQQFKKTTGALIAQSALMSVIVNALKFIDPNQRKKFYDEEGNFKWSYLIGSLAMNAISSWFSIIPIAGDYIAAIPNAIIASKTGVETYDIEPSTVLKWVSDDYNKLKTVFDNFVNGKETNDYQIGKALEAGYDLFTGVSGIPINNILRGIDYGRGLFSIGDAIINGKEESNFLNMNSVKSVIASCIGSGDTKLIDSKIDGISNSAKLTAIFESNKDIFYPTSSYVTSWIKSHSDEETIDLSSKSNFLWMLNDMKAEGLITDNDIATIVASYNEQYKGSTIYAKDLAEEAYTSGGKEWLGGYNGFSDAARIAYHAGVPSRDDWVSMYTEAGFTNDEGAFHVAKEITANAIENGFVNANNYEQYGLTDEQFQSGLSEWYMIDAFNTAGMSLYAHMYDKNGDGQLSSGELNDMKGNKTATGADLYETFLSLNPNIANIQSTSNPTQASEVKAAQKEIQQGFKDRTEAAKEGQKAIKNSFDANGNGSISQEELSTITAEQCAEMSDEELYYLYNEKVKSASAKSIKNNAGMTNIQNEWLKRVEKIGEPSYELPTLYTPSFSSSSFNRSTDIGFKPVTFDELF